MSNYIEQPVASQDKAVELKNTLGQVATAPFYIWANDDCANKTNNFNEAKAIRLTLFNEGGESVYIVDADGVEVVDAEIEAHEALANAGYFAGARKPDVKPEFPGAFMVNDPQDSEGYAIVGDDIASLILEARDHLIAHASDREVSNYTGDPINATIQCGILTMPDGQAIDLTKIQAAINFGFQETGEKELMEACDLMSKITGLEQGPSGEFVAAGKLSNYVETPHQSAVDKGLLLRTKALVLLQEAQAVDGLKPFTVTHTHSFGESTYVLWAAETPTQEEAEAVLDCEFEPDREETLVVEDCFSLEEMSGVAVTARLPDILESLRSPGQDDSPSP